MSRHIALLRGINVGGKGLLKMTDLRRLFERAGAEEVSTYIASGNVLFSASARDLPGIRRRAESALENVLGAGALTVWRTAAELQRVLEADPFPRAWAKDEAHRYVIFLARKPKVARRAPWRSERDACHVVAMTGLHAYVRSYRLPTGWSGFPNNMLEDALGVNATTRTWRTVEKLAALVE